MKSEIKINTPENVSEIPESVRKDYCAIAELLYADHGAVFYRGEVVLKGKAYTLDIHVTDLNGIEDSIFEGEVPKKMSVLKMLDVYDDIFGETLRTDISDGAEYRMNLSESTAPWELGWTFLVPMLYGAFPSDWAKRYKKAINKQRSAK